MTQEIDKVDHDTGLSRIGPMPMQAVAALADLGMTDAEIARYFRVARECITRLRRRALRQTCGGAELEARLMPVWPERTARVLEACGGHHVGPGVA